MNIVKKTLTASLLALSIGNAFAAGSPGVEHNTQAFLDALNAGTGKPIEQLTPKDARAVLTGAQAGVKLTLPKAVLDKHGLDNVSFVTESVEDLAQRLGRRRDEPVKNWLN